jgi:hypothetical protein
MATRLPSTTTFETSATTVKTAASSTVKTSTASAVEASATTATVTAATVLSECRTRRECETSENSKCDEELVNTEGAHNLYLP